MNADPAIWPAEAPVEPSRRERAEPRRSIASLRAGAIAAFLGCVLPQMAVAQTATDVFVRLWSEHLEICGDAMVTPQAPVAERLRPYWSENSQYFASEDRAFVSILHRSEGDERTAYIEVFAADGMHNVICVMGYSIFGAPTLFPDSAGAASEVRALITSNPGFAVSGGLVTLMPGSDESLLRESFRLIVAGGFPEFPGSATKVLITENGISLETHAAWRIEQ